MEMELLTPLNMQANAENSEKFPKIARFQFRKLGTDIDIQVVVTTAEEEKLMREDFSLVEKVYDDFTKIFSRFDLESELSKLNLKLGVFNLASSHLLEIVKMSLKYNSDTDGIFDPRILDVLEKVGYFDDFSDGSRLFRSDIDEKSTLLQGPLVDDLRIEDGKVFFGVKMDFSGIAKGYITDRVAEFLISKGWNNFLVDSGGDMFMQGLDEEQRRWTIAVEGIDEKKMIFALDKKGIATSGIGRRRWEIDGKRVHHIVDPKNPENFSFDLKSVSVIADDTTSADVWAKTIFLMGAKGGMLYAREHDLAVVILNYRGAAWISPKAKEHLY